MCGGDYPVVVNQRSATDVREGASACLVVEGGLPRPLPSSRVHAVHDPILRVSGQTGSCKTIFNQSIWLVLTYFIDFIVRIKSWRFPLFSLSLSRLSKITWSKIAMELDISVWYSPCYKHFVIYIYCSNKLLNVISIIRFLQYFFFYRKIVIYGSIGKIYAWIICRVKTRRSVCTQGAKPTRISCLISNFNKIF